MLDALITVTKVLVKADKAYESYEEQKRMNNQLNSLRGNLNHINELFKLKGKYDITCFDNHSFAMEVKEQFAKIVKSPGFDSVKRFGCYYAGTSLIMKTGYYEIIHPAEDIILCIYGVDMGKDNAVFITDRGIYIKTTFIPLKYINCDSIDLWLDNSEKIKGVCFKYSDKLVQLETKFSNDKKYREVDAIYTMILLKFVLSKLAELYGENISIADYYYFDSNLNINYKYNADKFKEYLFANDLKACLKEENANADISGVYYVGNGEKDDKKLEKALKSYALIVKGEKPIFCYDATFFGGGDNGVTLTTRGLYVCEKDGQKDFYPIDTIDYNHIRIQYDVKSDGPVLCFYAGDKLVSLSSEYTKLGRLLAVSIKKMACLAGGAPLPIQTQEPSGDITTAIRNDNNKLQEESEALKWCRKAAEQGDVDAQYELAVCYENGNGVEQDYSEAVKWYRQAAEQGMVEAQYNLGVCYENGDGVEQDYGEAVKWYRKAAEQDDEDAQYSLGVCYENGDGVEQDYGEAVKWYRKAAEQGDADAQYSLGVCYENGDGVEQDYGEAIKWYRKAAEQGLAEAQNRLGVCYENGQGVEQNYSEAVSWYRKAAKQGLVEAQYRLGVCYENGQGIKQDYSKAVSWYLYASNQKMAKAQYSVGVCYEKGYGIGQDYKEAVKWYRKAAEQGLAGAQYNLGVCYENGQGVEQDYNEAVKWYRQAADQGYTDALETLEKLNSMVQTQEPSDDITIDTQQNGNTPQEDDDVIAAIRQDNNKPQEEKVAVLASSSTDSICCPECGCELPKGAKFCYQCGCRIPTERVCPSCGEKLDEKARFCMQCGTKV